MMYSVCPSNNRHYSKHGLLGSFSNLNCIQLELVHQNQYTETIFIAYENLYKGALQSRPETLRSAFIFCRKLPPNIRNWQFFRTHFGTICLFNFLCGRYILLPGAECSDARLWPRLRCALQILPYFVNEVLNYPAIPGLSASEWFRRNAFTRLCFVLVGRPNLALSS